MHQNIDIKRVLVFRLSSMGDLILSQSFLEALAPEIQVDWIVSEEFAFLLEGHPRINKLIKFNRSSGLGSWIKLLKETLKTRYSARVDLHLNLRTRLARLYFAFNSNSIPWFAISKTRFRFYGYLIFKKWFPKKFRPEPFWQRFSKIGSQVNEFLNFKSANVDKSLAHPHSKFMITSAVQTLGENWLTQHQLKSKHYLCIMPASRWTSKEWGVEKYFEFISHLQKNLSQKIIPVLMGRSSDRTCLVLAEKLKKNQIHYVSLLDEPKIALTAFVLSQARAYLGSDTGLAHLAEAVGTRAWIIFGPTRSDLGFGPWREESRALQADVFCSPCSKDGRTCFRFWEPYACLNKINISQPISLLESP